MTEDTGRKPVVTSYLDLDMVTHKPTKDALRRAAAATARGPVWITEGGERIAAIVPAEWTEVAETIIASATASGNPIQ